MRLLIAGWISLLVGILLIVVFSDYACMFQLAGLLEKNESLTVNACIATLFGLGDQNSKNEVLKFLGIGIAGLLLMLQAAIANRRAKAVQQTAEAHAEAAKAQASAAKQQAVANEYTEQGQRQERLKNAIEHLGNRSESVRLGGAHELLHLAKDVKELRNTVFDILCAHIRAITAQTTYREWYRERPSEEIQSILTLLFVKEHDIFKGLRADLRASWLNGVDLWYANLNRADLWKAHLSEAGLLRAELQGAILMEVDMKESQLYGADLRGALLNRSDFRGCEFIHANLQGISVENTKFQGAKLQCANLRGANLRNSLFQATDLTCAKLEGALLDRINMAGAELFLANLDGVAGLEREKKDFEERLRDRIGKKADLAGTIFTGGITEEDMEKAVISLSDGSSSYIREKLEKHVNKPETNTLPEDCDASVESYSSGSAETWIGEYNKELSPEPDWHPLPQLLE